VCCDRQTKCLGGDRLLARCPPERPFQMSSQVVTTHRPVLFLTGLTSTGRSRCVYWWKPRCVALVGTPDTVVYYESIK
jgi:hypothetical protein